MLPLTQEEIISRAFGKKPLPRKERQTANELLTWLDENTNIYIKPISSKRLRSKVHKAILDTISKDWKLDNKEVFSKSRKRTYVYVRALAHYTYQTLTGSTQSETTQAFGNTRARITYVHMRDLVQSLASTYPDYHQKMTEFFGLVQDKLNTHDKNNLPREAKSTIKIRNNA